MLKANKYFLLHIYG